MLHGTRMIELFWMRSVFGLQYLEFVLAHALA